MYIDDANDFGDIGNTDDIDDADDFTDPSDLTSLDDLFGADLPAGLPDEQCKTVTWAEFYDWGLRGLYNGETAKDIALRKGLNRHQNIFDWMNSDELEANQHRVVLTERLLKTYKSRDPRTACRIHYQSGVFVRQTLLGAGHLPPEDQPTPKISCIQLQWEMDPEYRIQMN